MPSNSNGLYLKRFNEYVLAAPYNLQPGPDHIKMARARGFLSQCVPNLLPYEHVILGHMKAVKGWRIVHEIGQFEQTD